MRPDVHWIDLRVAGRLAIMARPRAGDWLADEVRGWRAAGIDIVVTLLEAAEIDELDLRAEADLCREHGMEVVAFPIPDRGVPPSVPVAASLARGLAARIEEGKAVAVHCRAGIGRSSLIAACVMVCGGAEPAAAFELIGKARGMAVPDTAAQRDWVVAFADATTRPPKR